MTAHFHPPPSLRIITAVCIVFAIAMPFGRREDWVGWLAFLAVGGCATVLWALLLRAAVSSLARWWRERSKPE